MSALAATGCPSSSGPPLKIVVAGNATSGRCTDSPNDITVTTSGISTLRMSVLKRVGAGAAATRTFLCDRVFRVPQDQPHLKLPVAVGDDLDIVAEGFVSTTDADSAIHGNFRRKATGELIEIAPKGAEQKALETLRMFPVEASSCALNTLTLGRAFHTATKLPTGDVIVIGGLVASSAMPSIETVTTNTTGLPVLQMTGSIELYNAKTGEFALLAEATPPSARAFHQAYLLTTDPPYQVLLVGGATIDDTTQPAFEANNQFAIGPRLVPLDNFTPLTTKSAGAELLTIDPVAKTVTRTAANGYAAAMFQAGTLVGATSVVSDGVDYVAGAASPIKIDAARSAGELQPRTSTTTIGRFGATLSPLHDGNALLWGGNYASTQLEPVGQLMSNAAGGTLTLATASVAGEARTAFHTATVVDPTATVSSLLLTGGFVFNASGAGLQAVDPSSAVRLLTYTPGTALPKSVTVAYSGYSNDPACTASDRFRPAGWESAVSVSRNRALVSGGSPTQTSDASCRDCPDGQNSAFCALSQLSLFDGATSTLAKFGSGMLAPRFGHTMTVLDDGSVLVVGGVSSFVDTSGTSNRILRDIEVVNVRTALPPVDITAAAPTDLDDPIANEIKAAGLERLPGRAATLPGAAAMGKNAPKPAKECGIL